MTPSSKCVGDLALYLVTRGLAASDVTDPAKKGQVDFPDSVVGLLEGRLGFPHKGFPEEVINDLCVHSRAPARVEMWHIISSVFWGEAGRGRVPTRAVRGFSFCLKCTHTGYRSDIPVRGRRTALR